MTDDEPPTVIDESTKDGRFVAPWASGERLRKIEKDVIIPNLMKKKAKVICKDYMEAFSKCTSGRMLSLAWSCKQELADMKQCITEQLDKPEFFIECRTEYLKKRESFQEHYVATGDIKDPKRKDALF